MAQQRQYESATVFNARIVDMRHLWMPSTEYQGKKQDKPSYFASFIVPKTQAQWFNEPALAGIAGACGKIWQSNQHILSWPVVDGDIPSPEGKQSEWAKGHWLFSGNTSNSAPNVELVQAGGHLTKLQNKVGVKSGDFCMAGLTAAVKQNDARAVKLFLNAVVFTAPGEEIVFANSVSGAELMKMAEAQGLRPTGFSGSPGFGAPQPGFPPGGGFHGNPNPGQPHAFAPASPAPGFTPAPAFGVAPAPGGMPSAAPGNVTFPSNPGFAPPPASPFPPR